MGNTFPHSTPELLKIQFANSAKEVMRMTKDCGRNDSLQNCFEARVHELMHFRSHTVDTDW